MAEEELEGHALELQAEDELDPPALVPLDHADEEDSALPLDVVPNSTRSKRTSAPSASRRNRFAPLSTGQPSPRCAAKNGLSGGMRTVASHRPNGPSQASDAAPPTTSRPEVLLLIKRETVET